MIATRSHYDVLGVRVGASHDEVRRAYHRSARLLHPDRHGSSSPDAARRAERAMQDVNEAWRVLRDPARRRAYDDRLLGRGPTGPGRSAGSPGPAPWPVGTTPYGPSGAGHGSVDPAVRVVRGLPWVLLVLVMAAVFVFTAYAGGSGDDPPPREPLVGACVRVQPGIGAVRVPCQGPSDGQVKALAVVASGCPSGTAGYDVPGEGYVICLGAPALAQ